MLPRTLLLTLIASSFFAFAQEKECAVEEDGKYYDLSPLKSNSDYSVKTETGREYVLNVCTRVLQEPWALDNAETVGAKYRGARSDISMGTVNTTVWVRNGNPMLMYTDGSPCSDKGPQRASTVIRFICDESVYETGEPKLLAQLPPNDDDACAFVFEWRTHVACPTSKPGSGIIAILAVIAMILLVLYIVIGVVYRRTVLGYRGLDQFPRISLIRLSDTSRYFSEFVDWLRDLRDHFRGGARDLWPRSSNSGGFRARRDGFDPLAREEEETMFRDGPDGPDPRFSIDEEDVMGPRELQNDGPPVPNKNLNGMDSSGVIRL
ncbi:hypothetical protein M422DRAFT_775718 [Sphaerobolus stellatus SS14]|nr:hypothetical protein M422DRAFT_775718 [Sphaerobolus stellatus SS14]